MKTKKKKKKRSKKRKANTQKSRESIIHALDLLLMGETREPETASSPGGTFSVSKKKLKTEKETSDSHTPAKRKVII